jgi:formylglycine-generating enzyme required for sulfatase activity
VRFHQVIAIAALALAGAVTAAHAEKRVALVIGNERYASLPASGQLQKAVNDARAVGAALTQIGFDVVTGENLGRQALIDRLDEVTRRLAPGDTAFFFFSGHGVAIDGVNYILPADVPDVGDGQGTRLKGAAIAEDAITAELVQAGARVAVVVLDACRNNPFARSGMTKGVGGEKGLAPHEPPGGVFTFYAAGRGETALDRLTDSDPDRNSVFTRALLPALTRPGLDLPAMAVEVRERVTRLARSVNHDQRPAYYDGTSGGRIFLAGVAAGPGTAGIPPAPGPQPLDVAEAWKAVQGTTSVAVVDEFIREFGNVPVYGALARQKREELAKSQVAVVVAPPQQSAGAPLTAAQERGLKPKATFRECTDCPEMVVVPAGSFTMGAAVEEKDRASDESPQHRVTTSKQFAVGKLHVTVDQFAAFVNETGYQASSKCYKWPSGPSNGSWRDPGFAQEGSHPVICVTWDDANAYAEWMAKKTRKPYRLLSEAEWEYAARGRTSPGTYPRFWFGDDEKELCRNGNGADQKARDSIASAQSWTIAPCNDGYVYTSPAGHYQPNAFGLYDMTGNAWQWTADCYHDSYNGAPADGSAWTTQCREAGRVARGGAWYSFPKSLRAAQRYRGAEGSGNLGIRLARTLI